MFRFKGSLQFKFVSAIICIVVPLLGIIFLWQGVAEEKQAWSQVVNQARVLTRQIILTRQWVSDSQGVFLRTDTPGAQGGGGFYSDLLPTERGVMQRFTPSMVTKQLSLYSFRQNLYRFRLAGLSPMNPENRPDEFELAAIKQFAEAGSEEYYSLADHDGEAVFQYSAPLYVDETCQLYQRHRQRVPEHPSARAARARLPQKQQDAAFFLGFGAYRSHGTDPVFSGPPSGAQSSGHPRSSG